MGTHLTARYRAEGREVVTIGRSGSELSWHDAAGIAEAVDGAALVIGLAGKSVNCRYNAANRAKIFRSRLDTTAALSEAIAAASVPPPLWINASTATIYRHAEDRPMTEEHGELGRGFSVEVAKAWERALFAADLPNTRRVALRSAIVLGDGGVLGPLERLARLGLGGTQFDGWWPTTHARLKVGTVHRRGRGDGRQRFSWVHIDDIERMLDFIEATPALEGAVNASSPHPVTNRRFMADVRQAVGAPFGVPTARWMLEIGAMGMRTETELILKSRWVLPQKLTEAGFEFEYPDLAPALRELLG